MILADPGQTPACSLPNPTASPRLVVSPPSRCQAVLTRPYLTHSWLPASVDRLLEGKPAAIWNITQALPSRPCSAQAILPHICPRRSNNREVTLSDAVSQCRRSRAQTPAVVERMSVRSLCACGLWFLSSQTSAGHQLDACWASWCSKTGSKQRSRVKTVDGFQLSEELNLWSEERKAAFYLLEEWRPWLCWGSSMRKSEDTFTMSSFAWDLLPLTLERYQVGEVALPLMTSGWVPFSSTVGFSTHLLKKYGSNTRKKDGFFFHFWEFPWSQLSTLWDL